MIITYIADVFKIKIQFIMALNILLALLLELSLWCCFNHEGNVNRRPFVLAILFLAIGTICSFLDLTGRWCNPKDHNSRACILARFYVNKLLLHS